MKSSDHISRKALLKDLRKELRKELRWYRKQLKRATVAKFSPTKQRPWECIVWLLESLIDKYDAKV